MGERGSLRGEGQDRLLGCENSERGQELPFPRGKKFASGPEDELGSVTNSKPDERISWQQA